MKFTYSLFFLLSFTFIFSCSEQNSKEEKNNNASSTVNIECQEFLKGYEKYVDDYIVAMRKYKTNPNDMSIIADFNKIAAEAATWTNKTPNCTNDLEYASKLLEVQTKFSKAALELTQTN